MTVRLQQNAFDPGDELTLFHSGLTGGQTGAVVSFTGVVRNTEAGDLRHMEIEHYPAMTAPAIDAMVTEARARWSLAETLIIHRHGVLYPNDVIMMVATAARHRGNAFAGAEFLMDYLKSRAPFWKKEVSAQGAQWVNAREADEQALDRW